MPEPVTIVAVGAGGVLGWKWLKNRFAPPPPLPPPTGCDSVKATAVAQQGVAQVAGGAGAGASAGPVGAGVGAGIGALNGIFGLIGSPCGKALADAASKAVADAGKKACAKAEDAYHEVKKRGGSIPYWDKMSCDQKIATIAGLGPLGLGLGVIGGAVVGGTQRVVDNATSTTTKIGGGHVTVGGHKIF